MPRRGEPGELGRGRSGFVLRARDDRGRPVARKVFVGDAPATLVHYLISGAPGAYAWSEAAGRCAILRRRLAASLVQHWFGDRLTVAAAYELSWNATHRAFQLDTAFVEGDPVPLRTPFDPPGPDPLRELQRAVMRPLQASLAEAGLDGAVWQAGLGNPAAPGNFLRVRGGDDPGGPSWAWIDLESGVPAPAGSMPGPLFSFYLPRSWRHRRPLFDDVDVDRLRRYLGSRNEPALSELGATVDELERWQDRWRSPGRLERGIRHRLQRGALTAEQADWYRRRPGRWYLRESLLAGGAVLCGVWRLARSGVRFLARFDYVRALRHTWRFLSSERFRAAVARRYVRRRIARWRSRRQLRPDQAAALRRRLRREGTGSYLTDFGVHVAIKPAVKALQWGAVPALLALGAIGPLTASAFVVFGGMAARTAYTAGRSLQAGLRGERLPWTALAIGLLPVVGNAAYPAQILADGASRRGRLAAFILYDTFSAAGEMLPIWGGPDSLPEHALNRLAHRLFGLASRES